MSLIRDVRDELGALDLSKRRLRSFALLVGATLTMGAGLEWRRGVHGGAVLFGGVAALVVITYLASPAKLRPLYRTWMAIALAMGWVTSRVILTLMFVVAITPVALVSRLLGKRFLERDIHRGRKTYWEKRAGRRKIDYEKLF